MVEHDEGGDSMELLKRGFQMDSAQWGWSLFDMGSFGWHSVTFSAVFVEAP